MDAKKYARMHGVDLSNPNPTQSLQAKESISKAQEEALQIAEQNISDQAEVIRALQEEVSGLQEANAELTTQYETLKDNYDKLADSMISETGELKQQLSDGQSKYDELLAKAKKLQDELKEVRKGGSAK